MYDLRYMSYKELDVVNGPGTRCTLFVSHCTLQCKGCFQQPSWPKSAGHLFTDALADQIICDLTDTRISRRGLSLSGGDPFEPENVADVSAFVSRVRAEAPRADIWAWTGRIYEELNPSQAALALKLDVLVDGPFVQDQADPSLIWRGSKNQRVIDVPASIRTGKTTLLYKGGNHG